MKVITVKQPFATLIAEGFKEYEFRTWYTHYRGEILIHAGKGIDQEAMKRYEYLHLQYPTGCIPIDDSMRKKLKDQNPMVYHGIIKNPDWHGYGFQLENIQKLKPIFIKGKLGLWNYDGKMETIDSGL